MPSDVGSEVAVATDDPRALSSTPPVGSEDGTPVALATDSPRALSFTPPVGSEDGTPVAAATDDPRAASLGPPTEVLTMWLVCEPVPPSLRTISIVDVVTMATASARPTSQATLGRWIRKRTGDRSWTC